MPSNVRFAAVRALRNSLGIFVTTILMVPAVSVVHRVFDGTWYVNWRLMLSVSGVLTSIFFVFWLVTQLFESAAEEVRERQMQFVFPGAMWVRGIYLTTIAMGIVIMVGTYREGDPWGDVAFPVVLVLLGYLAWPRAIEISDTEVRQRRILFGFKRIPLAEISSVVSDPTSNEAVVFGANGVRIVHTMMHVEHDRFVHRLNLLTGKNLNSVSDFAKS